MPRALFELKPIFLSMIGCQASGKSYFLASMTWRLRNAFPKHFGISFTDADPEANMRLNNYEQEQFLNPDLESLVRLEKTQEMGDGYHSVNFGSRLVQYPQPFLFSLRPTNDHPKAQLAGPLSRAVIVYDNAGESFEPGKDTPHNPVTQHVSRSNVLMFLFDPTQDVRFRQACQGKSSDPQVTGSGKTERQEITLHEVASRVRRYIGLSHSEKHDRPLIVVVTKYDAWWPLLGEQRLEPAWVKARNRNWWALDLPRVQAISDKVRDVLWQHSQELVSAAETFASEVIYIPVSATGNAPETDPKTGLMGHRPRDMQPMWVEIPMLTALCKWDRGIIAYTKSRPEN